MQRNSRHAARLHMSSSGDLEPRRRQHIPLRHRCQAREDDGQLLAVRDHRRVMAGNRPQALTVVPE